jgi:hypothetical protein
MRHRNGTSKDDVAAPSLGPSIIKVFRPEPGMNRETPTPDRLRISHRLLPADEIVVALPI